MPRAQSFTMELGFVAIGAVIALIGVVLLFNAWLRARGATRTTGVIVGTYEDGDGGLFPIVEFDGPDGRARFIGSFSKGAKWPEGEIVPVLYPRSDARRAEIATFGQRYGFALILLAVSVAIGAMAAVARAISSC